MTYIVEIIKTSTGEVVQSMPASSERLAQRIELGANINLNHAEYHTAIREEKVKDAKP